MQNHQSQEGHQPQAEHQQAQPIAQVRPWADCQPAQPKPPRTQEGEQPPECETVTGSMQAYQALIKPYNGSLEGV